MSGWTLRTQLVGLAAAALLGTLAPVPAQAGPPKKKKDFDVHGLLHGIGDIVSAAKGPQIIAPVPPPGGGPGGGIGPGPGPGGAIGPGGGPGGESGPIPKNPLPKPQDPDLGPVLLVNPPENGAEIHYLLDDRRYTLPAGYMQSLEPGRIAIVQFDRGGSLGARRYRLADGTFEFSLGQDGWELYRKTYEVTVDNTSSGIDFHYRVDHKPTVIKAGFSIQHQSRHPMLVEFHDGIGPKLAKKTLDNGWYQIGINPATGRWDFLPVGTRPLDGLLAWSTNPNAGASAGTGPAGGNDSGIQPIGGAGAGPQGGQDNPLPAGSTP